MKRKSSNVVAIIFPTIFILVGLMAIVLTFVQNNKEDQFMQTAKGCSAYVDYVDTYTTTSRTGTGKHRRTRTTTHYDAYVHYTVDGITYSNVEIPGTTYRRKGDIIQIYYNPQNPRDIMVKKSATDRALGYMVGGLFTGIGVLVLIFMIRVVRKDKKTIPQTVSSNDYSFNNNYIDYNSNSDSMGTYTGYNSNSDSMDTYTGYNSNNDSMSTYTGYDNNQQNSFSNNSSFSTYSNNSYQTGNIQNSPFGTYSDNSYQNNNSQSSPFGTYSDNSYQNNNSQSSPFGTYSDNSYQNNNNQSSPFGTYSDNSYQNNNSQGSPFSTYSNNTSSQYDYNSTITSDSYSNTTSSADIELNSQPKSPFERYSK